LEFFPGRRVVTNNYLRARAAWTAQRINNLVDEHSIVAGALKL
jgi:hypothetical protein